MIILSAITLYTPQIEDGKLQLYLYIDTGGEIQFHQRIYRLLRRLKYIQQPFVRPHFKLLT